MKEIKIVEGMVKAISKFDAHNSMMLDNNDWYKVEDQAIENIFKKGQKVKFSYSENQWAPGRIDRIIDVNTIVILAEPVVLHHSLPQVSASNQDDMIDFETLLADAHKKYPEGFTISTALHSVNMVEKWAVFKARIETKNNGIYEAHGDATQDNIGEFIKPHFLRMAETRAIARALRWATNNAKTAKEELKQ